MLHLLAVVVLIAIADSANPSTIAPALYLAADTRASRSLVGFTAGVFIVNLTGGLIILLGPGQALLAVVPRPGVETRHVLELALGIGLLVLGTVLWLGHNHVARHVKRNQDRLDRSPFLLGAAIMAVELPTAVPYFAAIAALVASGKNLSTQISLLAVFNAVFILPLPAILALRLLAGERGQRWLERLRAQLDQRLALLIPALVSVAAVVLIILGTVGAITD
jgi:cytochrome c biogenesis protein CcdA